MSDQINQWLDELGSPRGDVRLAAQQRLKELGVVVMPQLFDLLRRGNRHARDHAGLLLAGIGEPALDGLLEAAEGGDVETVRASAWALVDCASDPPVQDVLTRLLSHADREVGWAASCAELPASPETLVGWLRVAAAWQGNDHSAEWETWEKIEGALSALGDAGAKTLERALASEPAEVRAAAVRALKHVSGAAHERLLRQAAQDTDPRVRAAAAGTSAAKLPRAAATELLLALLRDQDASVLAAAARQLGNMRAAPAIALLEPLLRHAAPDVRLESAIALAHLQEDYRPLLAALKDEDAQVRAQAAGELGRLTAPGWASFSLSWRRLLGFFLRRWRSDRRGPVIAALKQACLDEDFRVRKAGLGALLILEAPAALPLLVRALADASAEVKQSALFGLKEKRAAKVEQVAPLLRDPSPAVRSAAANVLADAEGDPVPDLLHALSHNPDRHVSISLLQALRDRKDRRALPTLIHVLQTSQDGLLQSNALRALEVLRAPEIVPVLIEALGNDNPFTRQDAARILGDIGDDRAVAGLAKLLDQRFKPEERDENGIVTMTNAFTISETAAQALRKIGTPAARAVLRVGS